jgi:trimeric autotransporter adhesin
MTVTINGTTGIAGVDGSAGTPAIQGGDTNTGMFFPAADTIAFSEGGAEIARFDSSGNLGIGTSSPTLYSGYKTVAINGTTGGLVDFLSNGTLIGEIFNTASDFRINGASTYPIVFVTNGAERMRIDSSGNLLVGTTNVRAPLTVQTAPSSSAYGQIAAFSAAASDVGNAGISVTKYDNVTTTSQIFARFLVNQGATASGQINANGASAAAFGSYSDRRLKENIVDLPSQLANIMALRPVEYDYIESEGGGHQIGFVAQEVQAVYPDLVGEREDGMLTLSDMNKNDARLIKAIQEQQALITALTARIEALEAK